MLIVITITARKLLHIIFNLLLHLKRNKIAEEYPKSLTVFLYPSFHLYSQKQYEGRRLTEEAYNISA